MTFTVGSIPVAWNEHRSWSLEHALSGCSKLVKYCVYQRSTLAGKIFSVQFVISGEIFSG